MAVASDAGLDVVVLKKATNLYLIFCVNSFVPMAPEMKTQFLPH